MQKQKKFIKIGAFVLAALMIIGILPLSALTVFADPCEHTETEDEIITEPTCTEPGLKNIKCKSCGEVLESDVVIDALGHSWGEYAPGDPAPTCTEPGKEVAQCQRDGCDATDERDAPALGHIWGEYEVINEATCTEPGSKKATCTRGCGTENTLEINPLGHTPAETRDGVKEATATEPGYTGDVICSVCQAVIERGTVIPATGGSEGGEGGSEGGEGGEGGGEIPEHDCVAGTPKKENVVEATCTTEGSYDEVTYCTICNKEMTRTSKKTAATGHSWGEWKTTKEATESETGTKTRVCALCQKEETETIPVVVIVYEFVSGQHGTWYVNSGSNMTFRVARTPDDSVTFDKFQGVQVDGNTITSNNYTATKGGLILTLNPSYLQTLPATQHTLKVVFSDGSVSTDFTVVNQTSQSTTVGKTGDSDDVMIYAGIMFASLLGLGAVVLCRKLYATSK